MNTAQNLPLPAQTPLVAKDGKITPTWYVALQSLWLRTGGAPGADGGNASDLATDAALFTDDDPVPTFALPDDVMGDPMPDPIGLALTLSDPADGANSLPPIDELADPTPDSAALGMVLANEPSFEGIDCAVAQMLALETPADVSTTPWVAAPAHNTSPGAPGQLAYDSGFFYVCTAADTWARVAIGGTW